MKKVSNVVIYRKLTKTVVELSRNELEDEIARERRQGTNLP